MGVQNIFETLSRQNPWGWLLDYPLNKLNNKLSVVGKYPLESDFPAG